MPILLNKVGAIHSGGPIVLEWLRRSQTEIQWTPPVSITSYRLNLDGMLPAATQVQRRALSQAEQRLIMAALIAGSELLYEL